MLTAKMTNKYVVLALLIDMKTLLRLQKYTLFKSQKILQVKALPATLKALQCFKYNTYFLLALPVALVKERIKNLITSSDSPELLQALFARIAFL